MDKHLIEGIEACRPGSDDLQSPELGDVARAVQRDPLVRAHYERVQQSDAAISSAMDRPSVPPGLAERILERLGCAAPSGRAEPASAATLSDQAGILQAQTPQLEREHAFDRGPGVRASRWSRRQWLGGFASLAATVLIAALLNTWLRGGGDAPLEELADEWFTALGADWQDIDRAPGEFAVPSAVSATPTAWQWLPGHAGGGVAYRLEDKNGATAMLYVVRMSRSELPASVPTEPQSDTGGKAVGYWQSGHHVCVLVVPGDIRNYRRFISSAPVRLA